MMNTETKRYIEIPNGILFNITTTDETNFKIDNMFKYIHDNPNGINIPDEYISNYTTEVNYNGQTPLMYATYIDNINYVKILLKHDVGKVDDFNKSALDYAYERKQHVNNDEIIDLLEQYEYHE